MAKRRSVKRNVKVVKECVTGEASSNALTSEAIAAALSSVSRVIMKVCRLCETKDGPFLNIFGAENMTAKKIDDIMPFVVAENDNLPHKICFRCSAKVEELYEFIQKCVKTQESLQKALGKTDAVTPKVKTRTLWEEKLNESNISNDDICNALIKKAMEGLKDIPMLSLKDNVKEQTKEYVKTDQEDRSSDEDILNEIETKKRNTRLRQNIRTEESPLRQQTKSEPEKIDKQESKLSKKFVQAKNRSSELSNKKEEKLETPLMTTTLSIDDDSNDKNDESPKPFDIMDHVSMIKVNGVGILFQCKLCNRNFLKKEVVLSHACAKNGGKKIAEEVKPIIPDPPRIPMIKYINTRVQSEPNKSQVINDSPINIDDDDEEDDKPLVPKKLKPRIGPASKVKRIEKPSELEHQTSSILSEHAAISNVVIMQPTKANETPSLPLEPNLNSRYKLVPGPNNTFMLVVDGADAGTTPAVLNPKNPSQTISRNQIPKSTPGKSAPEAPYPVGLIKNVPQMARFPSLPETFTTPAMKKQMYTVVQTGNPSKLLISTKTQAEEELPKKRLKRSPKEELNPKPYSNSVEVNDRSKDAGFFTFINVDPTSMLQPSYVLPTDNNIQESQITTSTIAKPVHEEPGKYSCNMCNERFTREKKLLTHIQSHYDEMDREDELRAQKNSKKRRSKT